MIASSPFTANLSRIDLTRDEYENLIDGIKNSPFTDERSYGFIPEEVEPDILSAKLVFRSATTIPDFDQSSGEVVSIEQKRTDVIPFLVDYERGLLGVFSNKENTKRLITRLSNIGNWGISITPLALNLSATYEAVSSTDFNCQITGLRISNFSINEYTSGSYHLKVFEEHEGERLLDEYGDDVSYMTVEYEVSREQVSVGFYDSGSIRLYSNSSEDEALFGHIKNVIDRVGVVK